MYPQEFYRPQSHEVTFVERFRSFAATRRGKITLAAAGLALVSSPLHAVEQGIPDVPAVIAQQDVPVVSPLADTWSNIGASFGNKWKGTIYGYRYADEPTSYRSRVEGSTQQPQDAGVSENESDQPEEQAAETGTVKQASSTAKLALQKIPKGTWLSGASDIDSRIADFESYRGEKVTIAKSWSDKDANCQETQCALGGYDGYKGSMDLSIGAFYEGESWEGAAAGNYTERWRKALGQIREHRKDADPNAVTFINFAHEFNGSWYHWKVDASNVEHFKKAWRQFYDLVQTELVQQNVKALVIWNPNNGNHGGIPMEQMWPGDDVVDVVGVDAYNGNGLKEVVDDASWNEVSNLGTIENPTGQETWRKFAEKHGKPLAFPEWGCDPKKADDCGYYIEAMNAWFRKNAGSGPGKVAAETVFLSTDYASSFWPNTSLAKAQSTYAKLKWGS